MIERFASGQAIGCDFGILQIAFLRLSLIIAGKHVFTGEKAMLVGAGDQLFSNPSGQSDDVKPLLQASSLCWDSLRRALSRNEQRCTR